MGLSKHWRHWSKFSEESLELFVPVPQRHVFEVLNTESQRARALSHNAGESFFEPFRISAVRAYEPAVEITFWPEVLRRNYDPATHAEVLRNRDRPVRGIAVECHIYTPAAAEERLVFTRPALRAVDAAGGHAGQQHAQRIWDALAEYDRGVRTRCRVIEAAALSW